MKIYRRIALAAALTLIAVVAPAAAWAQQSVLRGPEEGQVRALVIGIDAYRNVRPLKGAVSDARDIENSLRRMGVADLTTLIDDRADRESVLSTINGLLRRTGRGDLVLLSIAGHGAQEPERV